MLVIDNIPALYRQFQRFKIQVPLSEMCFDIDIDLSFWHFFKRDPQPDLYL